MSVPDSDFIRLGFVRHDLASHFGVTDDDKHYMALKTAFDRIPEDSYAPGSGRYRCYARGLILPWSRQFTWIPPLDGHPRAGLNGYYQGTYNPEHAGTVRYLPDIGQEARRNDLLLKMIMFDFEQTYWDAEDLVFPLHVGVHLIKLTTDKDDMDAVSSPNELHQDGEPFTFAHLIYRGNAEGGVNIIAPPRFRGMQPEEVPGGERIATFELTNPLESYGVADHLVTHYVSPIRKGKKVEPGERAVILTDFTPMRHGL